MLTLISVILYLPALAPSTLVGEEGRQEPRLALAETREPVLPEDDLCGEQLALAEEILLPSPSDPRLVVSSYRGAEGAERDCPVLARRQVVVIWRWTDRGYVMERSAEGNYATAERFRFDDQTYLVLSQSWSTATRSVDEYLLLHVTSDAQIRSVPFSGGDICGGANLDPLGDDFEQSVAILRFEDDAISLETNIWKPGDGYKFPTGGRAGGTMEIFSDPGTPGGRRLRMTSCRVLPE